MAINVSVQTVPARTLAAVRRKVRIEQISTANKMTFAGKSWEIYGDWSDDPAKLETRVEYFLP
jgi:hypothetical protein